MSWLGRWLFLTASLVLPLSPSRGADAPAAGTKPARMDLYGDPLPPGAIARLGSTRFRWPWTDVDLAPDGKIMAVACADHAIRLCEFSSGKLLHILRADKTPALGILGFSRDGNLLATRDRWEIQVWDVQHGQQLWKGRMTTEVTSPLTAKPLFHGARMERSGSAARSRAR